MRGETCSRREGYVNRAMRIEDAVKIPLPAYARDPLLVVVDAHEERLTWVVNLLTFANYRVYAPSSTVEAFTWSVQHLIVPQAILFGEINPPDRYYLQWLLRRVDTQRGRQIPIVFLPAYLPDRAPSFSPDARGSIEILQLLWQEVPRRF